MSCVAAKSVGSAPISSLWATILLAIAITVFCRKLPVCDCRLVAV